MNKVKVEAVEEVLKEYEMFNSPKVLGFDVNSGVSRQPLSLEETVRGAMSRARNSFDNCNYSFGIESGLMGVPFTKTGKMDVCVCAIFDGREMYLGLSSAFEFPFQVMKLINEKNVDANEAFYRCGLTTNKKIGSAEGAIGMLTKERVTRKDYTMQAIRMALIHLENSALY